MELIIVAIIVVAVVLVLLFAGPSTNSNRSIVNTPYKPIDMPKYTQSTYARELKVKPYEEPVLIVPDDLTKEIFTRTNKEAVKKEGAKAEAIFNKSRLKKTSSRNKSKKDNTTDNSSSNFDMNLAAISASDESRKSSLSCSPNYSSKSCAAPVESSSSNDHSSNYNSSSSSCDSGGGGGCD